MVKIERNTKVSIITVVYNNVEYIESCIKSVINQTYTNIEYIIIDGGSTDGTVDVIQKYNGYITDWVSEKDNGIYHAMNKGINKSSGDIIGILNSDDWYEVDTVQKAVDTFIHYSKISLVHGAMNCWNGKEELVKIIGNKFQFNEIFVAPFNHPTCFVKKEVYKSIGLFDQSFPTAADYDFMLRFIQNGYKEYYIDDVLTNFRLVGVTSQSRMFPLKQIWRLLKKNNYNLLKRTFAILYRIIRSVISLIIDKLYLKNFKHSIRYHISYHK